MGMGHLGATTRREEPCGPMFTPTARPAVPTALERSTTIANALGSRDRLRQSSITKDLARTPVAVNQWRSDIRQRVYSDDHRGLRYVALTRKG
jgi:hypothetical protein